MSMLEKKIDYKIFFYMLWGKKLIVQYFLDIAFGFRQKYYFNNRYLLLFIMTQRINKICL